MKTLLTGASGFIGAAVLREMSARGIDVRAVYRQKPSSAQHESAVCVATLDSGTDWNPVLPGVHVVVHCAARAHVLREQAREPLAEYRRVNVDGTLNLARQAAAAGVKRFVFVSSIKVNGESTWPGRPFFADDAPAPQDAYGVSKAEAEDGLWRLARQTAMQLVVIRPVLVYGPGAKGNFAAMLHWLERGWPLPLARATRNRRSLVALDNLVDLIVLCSTHTKAANQTFLVSDGEDVCTAELLQRAARAQGGRARLWPLPLALLQAGAAALGKGAAAQRLLGSLQVDIGKTRELLGWSPPLTLEQGLKKAVGGGD